MPRYRVFSDFIQPLDDDYLFNNLDKAMDAANEHIHEFLDDEGMWNEDVTGIKIMEDKSDFLWHGRPFVTSSQWNGRIYIETVTIRSKYFLVARAVKCDVHKRPPDEELDEDGLDEAGDYWDSDCEEKCNYRMEIIVEGVDS